MSLAATATMVQMLLLLSGFWIIQTGLLAGLEFTEQKVEVVADQLRAEPIVQKVKEQQKLVDQLTTVTNILHTAGTVVLLIVAVIVLFIIVNTIRLAVVARSEEIEIMRLVGASDAFIRWPFVFEGAMVGLFGAAITLVLLYVLSDPIGGFMVGFFRVLPLSFGSLAR